MSSDEEASVATPHQGSEDQDPTGWATPLVDMVARVQATIHTKLLAGFMISALLLLAMGLLSIVVINSMNRQMTRVVTLQEQTDMARQGIYAVTAQSHFRAMALITRVDSWNDKITQAKSDFRRDMEAIRASASPEVAAILDRLDSHDTRFAAASADVQQLYEEGDIEGATDVHISAEHEISHDLEDELNVLINLLGEEAGSQ